MCSNQSSGCLWQQRWNVYLTHTNKQCQKKGRTFCDADSVCLISLRWETVSLNLFSDLFLFFCLDFMVKHFNYQSNQTIRHIRKDSVLRYYPDHRRRAEIFAYRSVCRIIIIVKNVKTFNNFPEKAQDPELSENLPK